MPSESTLAVAESAALYIPANVCPALREKFSGSRNFRNSVLNPDCVYPVDKMTSRPPSAASSRSHPTPHQTVSRSRSLSSTKVPPQAPKPSRRPVDPNPSTQTNPLFTLAPPTLVPRASCGKSDDILGPPDTQSSPFVKAGLKMQSVGPGPYGELEGILEWPPELYAVERIS